MHLEAGGQLFARRNGLMNTMRELQFDGLVGPTHNYAGLSPGNVASAAHHGEASNPRAAARQGLAKMRFVHGLGVRQAVLPPHERPSLSALRRIGFRGSDEAILAAAVATDQGLFLRLCASASAMWTANAATVAPSCDTDDGKVHITPANLQHMFHRSVEAATTTRVLKTIFADDARFVVHTPLPGGGQLADEGAANHLRLETSAGSAHVFGWGRAAWGVAAGPHIYPARQTREASHAIARLHSLDPSRCVFAQQDPAGIDAGAFHTDVLATGNGRFLMLHDRAFVEVERTLEECRRLLGEELFVVRADDRELPIASAVAAYPFNSQVLTLPRSGGGHPAGSASRGLAPSGTRVDPEVMAIVAPQDALEDPPSRAFLDRVLESGGPVRAVHYLDVRQSMHNGGGPACLRLRVPLTSEEEQALGARVVLDEGLLASLDDWVERHYRDRLLPSDLADPALVREGMQALDELTQMLHLGSVYDFQGFPDDDAP